MLSAPVVVGASFAYLMLLFGVAHFGDRVRAQGRSVIGNAWVYALSLGCTAAWTYFGSISRASGAWFLPIYLGPTLAMVLAWMVVRKMIRISRALPHHVDRRLHRQPLRQEPNAGGAGDADRGGRHRALRRAAAEGDRQRLTPCSRAPGSAPAAGAWWTDSTLYIALALAGFTIAFGTRHLDTTERHEGMVAAIALESVVKLAGLPPSAPSSPGACSTVPATSSRARRGAPDRGPAAPGAAARRFSPVQWFALMLLAMLSVIFLPRQFQVMVVENVDERHVRAPPGPSRPTCCDQPVRAADRARGPAAFRHRQVPIRETFVLRCRWPAARRRWRCWPSSAGCRRPPAW